MFGANFAILYAYLIGKRPHDIVYMFVTFVMLPLLAHRYYTYWFGGYRMYLADFCYLGNFTLLYYMNYASQNSELFVACYVFANGAMGSGILAFRNSLVFHKIDMLESLSIHAMPMTLTLHIRWETIPLQASLPLEEQRFAPLPDMSTWPLFFHNFFVTPYLIYFCWIVFYAISQFVVTDKVNKREADSSYTTFAKHIDRVVPQSLCIIPKQLWFLFFHFLYFAVTHLIAVLLWHSYWLNMAVACFLLQWSVYQGACYYMDYFAKRYEMQLAKLDKLEEVVVSTPTLIRQDSSSKAPNNLPT